LRISVDIQLFFVEFDVHFGVFNKRISEGRAGVPSESDWGVLGAVPSAAM